MLRVINLANAVFLAVASFFSYKDLATGPTRFFLATYIGIFALLLCLFESRVPWTEGIIRRNFGFMFTYTGRAVFLIFLGAICFGMIDSTANSNGNSTSTGFYIVVGAGCATLLNSILNCFIICSHPGFQELSKQAEEQLAGAAGGTGAGKDPSRMTEEQVKAYLAQHPEIAAQALGGVAAAGESVQPPAFTGTATGTETVPEWGSGASAPKADAAPQAASTTSSGGGWFGGFGRNKNKGATPKGSDAEAGYQPPSVGDAAAPATSPASITPVVLDAADSDNPFGTDASASAAAKPAPRPSVVAAAPVSAPAPAPQAVAAKPAAPAPAPAVAVSAPVDLEDNPFANDNPFDKDGF